MPNWIILNIRDCLKWGYGFKWFLDNRSQDYLKIASEDDLKKEWKKQVEIMGRDY